MIEESAELHPQPTNIVFGDIEDIDQLPTDPQIESASKPETDDDELNIELGPTQFDYDNLRRELPLGKAKLLLAKDGTNVIGFIAYTTPEHTEPNFIELMWVDPNQRSKGVADELLAKALQDLTAPEVSLDLWGQARAQRFFEKHGFVQNPGGNHTNRFTLKRDQS